MKITYADNGWTTFIDEDIKSLSNEDILEVCRLTVTNTVVVFRNQSLTAREQLDFCSVMGDCQKSPGAASISVIPGVLRVTGKKNAFGKEGLFGHKADLDWHANQPSNKDRKPLIWLYGVEGTVGSKTSWINNIDAYNDLDDDFKEELKQIKVYCGYKQDSYSPSSFFTEHVNTENPIPLVYTNKAGKVGLFFPFLQIFGFEGYSEERFQSIMTRLREHVLQDKYVYHHDWQDGDVVIAEQWLGIHKRWAFENMDKRILHRIAFDYSNVYN
jgi:taurine dioxygenase